jgi:vibriolysin
MGHKLSGGALCCVGFLALQGCTMESGSAESSDEQGVGQISSAINPPCDPAVYDSCTAEDDDWSGTVHTAIFTCKFTNSSPAGSGSNVATTVCSVPEDYALAGGGAEVQGFAQPGALLTINYPATQQTWLAQSGDLAVSFPHRLRAFAVGLRITGLTGAQLRGLITLTTVTTPTGTASSGAALIPSGHVLLGGGVFAPSGQYVSHSFPISNASNAFWVGAFLNSVFPNPGSGTVRAISLPGCLPQLGPCTNPPSGVPFRLTSQAFLNSSTNGTGYRVASAGNSDLNAVMTAAGGATASTNPGRILTQVIPTQGGAVAVNKDHWFTDTAGVTAYGVALKRL